MSTAALPVSLRRDERDALARFVTFVRQRFGTRVRDLRLFGSRARGEGHEHSDLDVLVVVDALAFQEGRDACTGDIMTDLDVRVSPFLLATEHWQSLIDRERLIAREIERDGVRL